MATETEGIIIFLLAMFNTCNTFIIDMVGIYDTTILQLVAVTFDLGTA